MTSKAEAFFYDYYVKFFTSKLFYVLLILGSGDKPQMVNEQRIQEGGTKIGL